MPVTPDVRRRIGVIQREWQRIDPKYLDEDEQRYWATIAGRQIRFDDRANFVQKLTDRSASKTALEQFLTTAAAENPNRRLRMMALQDRVSMRVERADFDDLVTLVTQAPTWEKERLAGIRILLRAIAEEKPDAPEQILARWTWKLAAHDAQGAGPPCVVGVPGGEAAPRRARELARATATRRTPRSSSRPRSSCRCAVGAALLASAEGYTPRATKLLDEAREQPRHDPGGRGRARREPPRAEAGLEPQPPPQAQAQEAGRGGADRGAEAGVGAERRHRAAARGRGRSRRRSRAGELAGPAATIEPGVGRPLARLRTVMA